MKIGPLEVGNGPPWVIAEASGEHLGSLDNAIKLIDAAEAAGAHGIKFQCFDPERLARLRGGTDKVLTDGLWEGWKLGDLYRKTHTPREWFPKLFQHAKSVGMIAFSSVFDPDDVKFMVGLQCPALKIAAAEAADDRLVKAAKATGLPLIISIGRNPINWLWGYADAVLYCPPGYPCQIESMNLGHIAKITHTTVGFSDHSEPSFGSLAAVIAVSHGAKIIEKHITLNRGDGGLDAAFSLEPAEFAKLVMDVRAAWRAQ